MSDPNPKKQVIDSLEVAMSMALGASGNPYSKYTVTTGALQDIVVAGTNSMVYEVNFSDVTKTQVSEVEATAYDTYYPKPTGTVSIEQSATGYLFTSDWTYDANDSGYAEGTPLYSWTQCSTSGGTYAAISGATGTTYLSASGDAGDFLILEVTPKSVSPYNPTGVVVKSAPVEIVVPS